MAHKKILLHLNEMNSLSITSGQLQMHGALMTAAFILVVAGIVLSTLGQHGWESPKSSFHSHGGFACVAVMFALMLSGLLVKVDKHGVCNALSLCHTAAGHIVYLFSCETSFLNMLKNDCTG